jgi:signal transduction histidine kinase
MLRDATLDLLKFSAFPELANALSARTDAVLHRWYTVVRDKLPSADALTIEQLRDELPVVLKELVKTIAGDDGSHYTKLEKASEGHGQTRFHQSFSINELLVEYAILRPLLLDEVATQMGRDLTPEEAATLNMGLDTAVRKGVTKFTAFQEHQLKLVAEAQSKYLSFLAHDLRGGLNGVLLMVEVLKRELAGETKFKESIHDLDSMRRSILDTVSTMDRFLHAERFRQGKVQPHNTTVALSSFLQDLTTNFIHHARAKGLEIVCDASTAEPTFTDKEMLLLILQNLVSNAVKYTAKGTIRLSLTKSAGRNWISVADEGPGIPADRLSTLFQPYVRGETHGQDGVGLGLSIAKQAADLIGATLRVNSEPGKGTTFILELPSEPE